jgi:2-methylcitrate dehydratase
VTGLLLAGLVLVGAVPCTAGPTPASCRTGIGRGMVRLARVGPKAIDACHRTSNRAGETAVGCNAISIDLQTDYVRAENRVATIVSGKCLRDDETVRRNYPPCSGDATSRAVRLALISRTGEMGYPSVLTAKTWGFYDVLFKGKPFKFQRKFGSYVMENVLFKISFPAEFHSQTAVECAMELHPLVKNRVQDIKRIRIRTHEAAIRIIDKKGPLSNPADRDHCIQYMVAVPLLFGRLTAADYEDGIAQDPRIDALRAKIVCVEDKRFTRDYHDPKKRSIANALTVEFKDGSKLKEVVCGYPIGHKRRRKEGMPVLVEKFKTNLARRFAPDRQRVILDLCLDANRLAQTPVKDFVDLMVA